MFQSGIMYPDIWNFPKYDSSAQKRLQMSYESHLSDTILWFPVHVIGSTLAR